MTLIFGVSLIAGCGALDAPSDTSDDQGAIIGGTTDFGDPAVVALFIHQPGAASGALCTGAIISPQAILTAAHCVNPQLVGAGIVIDVYQGPTFGIGATRLATTGATADDAFDPNNITAGHDVAVVTLAQPTAVAPLPWNSTRVTAANRFVPIRLVGYGASAHTNTGAGIKRTVTTSIDAVSSLFVQVGSSTQQQCHGDSGGPALQVIGGVESIIGITSFGTDNSQTDVCFGGSVDTRADDYAAFISAHL
jgi:secreted trypsin-like serine protease